MSVDWGSKTLNIYFTYLLAEEEEAGPGRAPAAVIEELRPGVDVQQRAVHHVISPDPGRPDIKHDVMSPLHRYSPVPHTEEVLAEGRVPLESPDGSIMAAELGDDHFRLDFGLL